MTTKKSAKKSTKKYPAAAKISTFSTAFEIDSSELPKNVLKKLDQHLRSHKSQTKIIAKVLEQAGLGLKVSEAPPLDPPEVPKPHPRIIILHVKSIPKP